MNNSVVFSFRKKNNYRFEQKQNQGVPNNSIVTLNSTVSQSWYLWQLGLLNQNIPFPGLGKD